MCFMGLSNSGKSMLIEQLFSKVPPKFVKKNKNGHMSKLEYRTSLLKVNIHEISQNEQGNQPSKEVELVFRSAHVFIYVVNLSRQRELQEEQSYFSALFEEAQRLKNRSAFWNVFFNEGYSDLIGIDDSTIKDKRQILTKFFQKSYMGSQMGPQLGKFVISETNLNDLSMLEVFGSILNRFVDSHFPIIPKMITHFKKECQIQNLFVFDTNLKVIVSKESVLNINQLYLSIDIVQLYNDFYNFQK